MAQKQPPTSSSSQGLLDFNRRKKLTQEAEEIASSFQIQLMRFLVWQASQLTLFEENHTTSEFVSLEQRVANFKLVQDMASQLITQFLNIRRALAQGSPGQANEKNSQQPTIQFSQAELKKVSAMVKKKETA